MAFSSAPPSNFPAKAEESSRLCQLVAAQTCLYGIKKKEEHIEQITERCLLARKNFSFKERTERD